MNKSNQVRLTFDCPTVLHTQLKICAAKRGVSMKEYVVESLALNMKTNDDNDASDMLFMVELESLLAKDSSVMKKLADR